KRGYILRLIDRWDGDFVIMGDFNEVRTKQERYGSVFNVQGVNAFNSFISLAGLIDLSIDGYAYTWAHKTTDKMSKLDRFLVSKGLSASFLFLSALCLDSNLSDHCPILMQELSIDYGPIPFRFFHSWFNLDGFDKMVEDTWKSLATVDSNASSNEEILSDRSLLLKELNDINFTDSLEGAQKSKVRWAIEGDENTKFFCDILNSKRSQLAIRRTHVDGKWIVDPLDVKIVFLKYFSTQLCSPVTPRICFADQFTNRYWKLLEHDIVAAIKEFFTSGSVLVNGSPISEFQFHKCLKQGDLLSPFLPILTMESLHLSFSKVTNAGLFYGIPINTLLTISYLFLRMKLSSLVNRTP
ncbi:RNA-directed DNA polymerase, eukaryota, partial [Tanacetum coccineum]